MDRSVRLDGDPADDVRLVHVVEEATESDRRLDMEEFGYREAARHRQTPACREVAVSEALPGALILMYHRVADVSTDPHMICVSPRRFAEHLEILREHARPMRLHDLERALSRGDVPPRAVVVTCDDGYADNLLDAKPLLERYDIPATAFVTSGDLGSAGEFWWDELERLVLRPGTLPETPRISVGGRRSEWSLGEAAGYTEAAFRQHRGWDLDREEDPTPRQRLHRALHALIMPLAEEERRDVLAQLRAQAAGSSPAGMSRRTLSSEEVVALTEGGLIEVGAHSVTHARLPSLPAARQRDEIRRSKADLEGVLGRPVARFAYPFAARTAQTVALVREAGFSSACGGLGAVRSGADPYDLPRVWVRDWDGELFARRLTEWFLD